MALSNRNKILEEGLTVLLTLLDRNSHTLKGLSYLGIHPKTLRRILQTLEIIPIAKVKSEKHNNINRWTSELNIRNFMVAGRRECLKCLKSLEINEDNFFRNRRNSIDGFNYICKNCWKIRQKIYYNKNKVIINKFRRKRYKRRIDLFIKRIMN